MYSAFVLRSIDTEYYIQGPARIFEYTVYIWGFGDLLEEILSLIVSCFFLINSFHHVHTILNINLNFPCTMNQKEMPCQLVIRTVNATW